MNKIVKLLSIALLIILAGCNNKKEFTIDLKQKPADSVSAQNDELRDFAKAVNSAIRANPILISVIKDAVMQKADGDYEVLYNVLATRPVHVNMTKGIETETSVRDLIECELQFSSKTRTSFEYLEQIQAAFPDLQVAVPVHVEDLTEDTIPTVAFIPLGVPDSEIRYLEGFDNEGNEVLLDAINEPDSPVIIVGLSERSYHPGMLAVLPPTNVTASRTSSSIIISWDAVLESDGYRVYRKAQGETSFSCIGSIFESTNISFEDTGIIATLSYSYYVVAFATVFNEDFWQEVESGPSSVVTISAPSVLPALSSFSVECEGNHLRMRWLNEGVTNCDIRLAYYDPTWTDLTPQVIATVSGASENSYPFTPSTSMKGKRIVFQATRVNDMGNSDTVYDYIYPPFRNVEYPSLVKLTQIDLVSEDNLNHLENWFRGAPEFYFKIVGVSSDGNAHDLVNSIEVQFSGRNVSEAFNRTFYSWLYEQFGGWFSAIRIYVIEGDRDGEQSFTATAKVGIKLAEAIEFSLGGSYTTTFNTRGQECGFVDYMYYENPVITKETQQELVRLSFGY